MIRRHLAKHQSVLFFGAAGVVGYVIDLATTLLLAPLLGRYLARIPAFLLAATATWLLNRTYAFKDRKANKTLIKEWLHYLSLMLVGLLVNYVVYAAAVYLLPDTILMVAIAIGLGSLAGMTVNFLSSSKFLYK